MMSNEDSSDSDCLPPDVKRQKLSNEATDLSNETDQKDSRSLLDFSDDVLLIIFSNLCNPEDLLAVSESCIRLQNLIHDKTLWETVNFLPNRITLRNLKKFLKFFQPSTKYLAIRGPIEADNTSGQGNTIPPSISYNFLLKLSQYASKLTTLVLVDHLIDSSKVKLEHFPKTLEHLTLKRCTMTHMTTERSYFYGLDDTLPNLKSLDLTGCQWFAPHSLLALSKSKTLESLNLTACDVSDCLPYASLAANFGFSTLKVLNLSETAVSDSEVTCFNSVESLRELIVRDGTGSVTDQSITSFGGPPPAIVIRYSNAIEIVRGRPPCLLERLEVTGYSGVTDVSLRHVKAHMPKLVYLDLSGTSVTPQAVLSFSAARPTVKLVACSVGH